MSGALITSVAGVAISKAIEKIQEKLGQVSDPEVKKDLEIELLKLEVEMRRLDMEDYKNKKGGVFEKVVTSTFPLFAYTFSFAMLSNIASGWYSLIFRNGGEVFLFPIPGEFYYLMIVYVAGFFGYRSLGQGGLKELLKK